MSFDVGADAYGQFMGRFSEPLATEFVALLGGHTGQRVLDVGCGPGALTAELVTLFGPEAVSAVDPSESFVAAISARFPEVDVRCAGAEQLPFDDDTFDIAAAQLVVPFMTDPVAGLSEMARVTRRGGLVAACVWDHAGAGGPLSLFWRAVRDLDPEARDESALAGAREGHLAELFDQAGLHDVESGLLTVHVDFATFDGWWQPFTFGVGPAGAHVAGLDEEHRRELRTRCATLLPHAPFQVSASAWFALGRA
jgi:SAM-dependent methyltransferase